MELKECPERVPNAYGNVMSNQHGSLLRALSASPPLSTTLLVLCLFLVSKRPSANQKPLAQNGSGLGQSAGYLDGKSRVTILFYCLWFDELKFGT